MSEMIIKSEFINGILHTTCVPAPTPTPAPKKKKEKADANISTAS